MSSGPAPLAGRRAATEGLSSAAPIHQVRGATPLDPAELTPAAGQLALGVEQPRSAEGTFVFRPAVASSVPVRLDPLPVHESGVTRA